MNSLKIFLAALFIILASNALSGCSRPEAFELVYNADLTRLAMARMDQAIEAKKTVELRLHPISETLDVIHLQLVLHNPENEPITSVESWLSYPVDQLNGTTVKMNESLFDLSAPYENGFDARSGLFKLGRAATSPVSASTIVVADLWFEKTSDHAVMIEAFDYRYDLSGHQSVNVMQGDAPVNLLLKPDFPLFVTQGQ